mmetsp:Transcript_39239/g.103861  ORF Transcript_39239/g.103861 Transcript_39239/m.103861 type:complete len:257 (+) Transcript_39239:3171-3941(+)
MEYTKVIDRSLVDKDSEFESTCKRLNDHVEELRGMVRDARKAREKGTDNLAPGLVSVMLMGIIMVVFVFYASKVVEDVRQFGLSQQNTTTTTTATASNATAPGDVAKAFYSLAEHVADDLGRTGFGVLLYSIDVMAAISRDLVIGYIDFAVRVSAWMTEATFLIVKATANRATYAPGDLPPLMNDPEYVKILEDIRGIETFAELSKRVNAIMTGRATTCCCDSNNDTKSQPVDQPVAQANQSDHPIQFASTPTPDS